MRKTSQYNREFQMNYKQLYYQEKFGVKKEDYQEFQEKIKQAYVEGLVWNFRYYFQGCVSWSWYYPYYYAPFISDLVSISHLKIEF